MSDEFKCSACGSRMIIGFIVDRGDHASMSQQTWVEGLPEPSFWTGLDTSGRNACNVDAYRCSGCHRVEFYATEKAEI